MVCPNPASRYSSRDYYPAGRMNSIVYPVTGGMEDWVGTMTLIFLYQSQTPKVCDSGKLVNRYFVLVTP